MLACSKHRTDVKKTKPYKTVRVISIFRLISTVRSRIKKNTYIVKASYQFVKISLVNEPKQWNYVYTPKM